MVGLAIYEPGSATTIFDGMCRVYSTCADCGGLMQVITAEQHFHPCCRERSQPQHDGLFSAAVDYAEWGWPVFPLATKAKAPAIPKRKGGQGFKQATDDSERIYRWWLRHPDHNIGLATGHMFDVIDIDTKDRHGNPSPGGARSFAKLLADGDIPDVHGIAVTPTGGLHLYVAPRYASFQALRPGIDYRGRDGYVVAPPSHLSVGDYGWLVAPSPKLKGDK